MLSRKAFISVGAVRSGLFSQRASSALVFMML